MGPVRQNAATVAGFELDLGGLFGPIFSALVDIVVLGALGFVALAFGVAFVLYRSTTESSKGKRRREREHRAAMIRAGRAPVEVADDLDQPATPATADT